MVRRTFHFSFRFLLEAVAVLIIGLLILLSAFMYRLSQGVVEINFLNPYIQDSVKKIYPNLHFNTSKDLLAFEDGEFKLIFEDVILSDNISESIIKVKSLDIGFSFASILRGLPSFIEANQADVFLKIAKDGAISIKIGENDAPKENDSVSMYKNISQMLVGEKLSVIKKISFNDSNLTIIDDMSSNNWRFKDIDISYERDNYNNIIGTSRIDVQGNTVGLGTIFHANSFETDIILKVNNLKVSDFANRYSALEKLDTIVNGSVNINLNKELKINEIGFSGDVLDGSYIKLEQFFEEPLDVEGEYDFIYKDKKMTTKKLKLNINGIDTNEDIVIDLASKEKSLSAIIDVETFDVSKVESCWPKGVSNIARDWVVNHIIDGEVKSARINIDISSLDNEAVFLDNIDGHINLSKATIDYLDTMPAVKNVEGKASFNKDMFDIAITAGNIDDVNVKQGSSVKIPFENTIIALDINLEGNLQTVAKVINNEPLQYIDLIDIAPEDIEGRIAGNLKLTIPVLTDDILVDVKTEISEASVKGIVFGEDILLAEGELNVNNDKLSLNLSGVLEKAKAHVKWDEFFASDSEYDRIAEIDGELDMGFLKDLGVIDLTSFFKGDLPVKGLYKSKDGNGSVFAKSDLIGTEVDLFPIPYKKSEIESGYLEISLKLEDNDFKELDKIYLKGDGIELDSWYDGELLYLSKLSMPENNIEVTGYIKSKEEEFINIDLTGTVGKNLSFKVKPEGEVNIISLDVENLGDTLQSLEIFNKLEGGKLTLYGRSSPESMHLVNGKLNMDTFNVKKMGALATILGAMSLDGLNSALGGDGITFEKLYADFSWDCDKKQISFKDGQTSGSSLGLTFDNIWDMKQNTIAMKGTVAPLQGISKAIGSIPIIGTVLTGANQEGIFGAIYSISGDLSDPKVNVNSASALTPGVLRDIFFSGESLEKTIEKENLKKEQETQDLDSIRGIQ